MKQLLPFFIGILFGVLVGWFSNSVWRTDGVKVITEVRHDTLRYSCPRYDTVIELRTEVVRLPIEIVHTDSVERVVHVKDSADVIIPITQKEYRDSSYMAWVSGYNPSLDSIHIYQQTHYVTKGTEKSSRRWSIGLQGGYGYTPKGFQPYIGIGVTYRLTR